MITSSCSRGVTQRRYPLAKPKCYNPGCNAPLNNPTFRLTGRDIDFCSRRCRETFVIWEDSQQKPKKNMKVAANDFGGAEVTRLLCDNPVCRKPVLLEWRGRNGIYHSNECLELMENTTMTTEVQTEATPTPSPIAAGAPSKKAPKKKAAAKAAPAKKAAAPPAAKGKAKAAKAETHGTFPRPGSVADLMVGFLKKNKKPKTMAELTAGVGKTGSWPNTVTKLLEAGLIAEGETEGKRTFTAV